MLLRTFFMVMCIPMMVCGAIAETVGIAAIPYEARQIFPLSWAISNPALAFFGSVAVFILALLIRPHRTVLVQDFKE